MVVIFLVYTYVMYTKNTTINAQKRIALVAHDNKKAEIVAWVNTNKAALSRHILYGTGTTGARIEQETGLPVNKLLSGPMGGDQQIGAMITDGQVDLLIFLWDPFEPLPHDPDVKALLRIAAVWNIPVACNRASADFLISSPLFGQAYSRETPDYQRYLQARTQTC